MGVQVAAALELGRHQIGAQGSAPEASVAAGTLGILDGYSFAALHGQRTPQKASRLPPVLEYLGQSTVPHTWPGLWDQALPHCDSNGGVSRSP